MNLMDYLWARNMGGGGSGGGSGGGLKYASGTVTLAETGGWLVVEMDFIPKIIRFWLDDHDTVALNGESKVLAGLYIDGIAMTQATNAGGTSAGALVGNYFPENLTAENDTTMLSPYVIRVRTSGGFNIYHNRMFRSGTTYNWEAWYE